MKAPCQLSLNVENLSEFVTKKAPSTVIGLIRNAYSTIVPATSYFENKDQLDKRKFRNNTKPEIFETKDPILLGQYFKLRDEIFKADRGWTHKDWFENEYDKRAHIVVAVENGVVIGGARLMLSTENEYLSGEAPGTQYTYKNLFEKMGLNPQHHYGEIDGLVVAKGYRDRSVTEEVFTSCIKLCSAFKCKYMVGIASKAYCRIYKSAFVSLGYSEVLIVKDFIWTELEEYNYSKDFPIIVNVSKH